MFQMTDEQLIKSLQAWYFPECHIVHLITTRIEDLKKEVDVWKKAHSDACDNWLWVYTEKENELMARIKELEQEACKRECTLVV
jgi:hypothetical protein